MRDAGVLLDDTPAALLAGRLELLDRYRISGARDGSALQVRLVTTNAAAAFREVVMRFADNDLVELELQDQFGQVTRIGFAEARANPQIAMALFSFEVPEGADVIDERGG